MLLRKKQALRPAFFPQAGRHMFNTRDVIRIADRWFDRAHPDSFDRQSRLQSCMVLVAIFHVVMSIACMKIDEYERKRAPRIVSQPTDLCFELMVAPPEFKAKPLAPRVPNPVTLIPSKENNTGGKSGAKAGNDKDAALVKNDESNIAEIKKLLLAPLESTKQTHLVQAPPTDIPSMQTRKLIASLPPVQSISQGISSDPLSDPSERGAQDAGAGQLDEGSGDNEGFSGTMSGGGANDEPPGGIVNKTAGGVVSTGNIAPYHKDMLIRISREWDPTTKKAVGVVLLVDIANDGSLISVEVVDGSGSRKIDRGAVEAVERTAFAPFPEWCKRKHLRFRIDLRNYVVTN